MTTPLKPARRGKRLLVASIGLATLSYATAQGCGDDGVPTSGNLLAPPHDAGADSGLDGGGHLSVDSGNLLPPPPLPDAATLDATLPTTGNLLPPPGLHDSGAHDAAADASDGATDASGH